MNISEQEFTKVWNVGFHNSYKILQNREDAEDVTQNAIIKLSVTDGIMSPTSWIKAVVTNLSLELIRSKKRSRKINDEVKVLLPTKSDKRKNAADPSKSYYDVLKSFSESKNKLRFFAKNNNMTYNQARSKIYIAMKNLKADKLSESDIACDFFTYSQSIVIYKIIRRYMDAVKSNSLKGLKRFVNDKSNIEMVEMETYLGKNELKNDDKIVVAFWGKDSSGNVVFLNMNIEINGKKITILSIKKPNTKSIVSKETKEALTNTKIENKVYLSKI